MKFKKRIRKCFIFQIFTMFTSLRFRAAQTVPVISFRVPVLHSSRTSFVSPTLKKKTEDFRRKRKRDFFAELCNELLLIYKRLFIYLHLLTYLFIFIMSYQLIRFISKISTFIPFYFKVWSFNYSSIYIITFSYSWTKDIQIHRCHSADLGTPIYGTFLCGSSTALSER